MTGGVGWGLQAGADITDFVVVLNSDEAVRAFSLGGNVTLGGTVSAAAGPIGTGGSVQSALASPAAVFSYSKSKGLYAGLSLEVRAPLPPPPFPGLVRAPAAAAASLAQSSFPSRAQELTLPLVLPRTHAPLHRVRS